MSSYDKYIAETAVVGLTFFVTPAGLLLAIILNAHKPNPDKFSFLDEENLKNASYRMGFQEGLHYTKKSRVWRNFWHGFATSIIVSLGFFLIPTFLLSL